MSYEPTNWKSGDTITAERLNKLEGGVAALSNYDFVLTNAEDGVTADGLSFEELYQKGAENITAKYINKTDGETIARHLWEVGAYTSEGIHILNFVFGVATADIGSDGNANIFNSSYTYTYSNGHYVFTPEESGN